MRLSLAEELLLIALNDEKGTVVFAAGTGLPFSLAGAALMELSLRGKVRIEGRYLLIVDPGNTGDALLDGCMQAIRVNEKPRTVRHWISKFGNGKVLRNGYLDRLVQKNILRREQKRVLFFFPSTRYPISDPRLELEERARLRRVVLEGQANDAQTLMLISLIRACDLVGEVFSKPERKEAKRQIEAMVKTEAFGKAVSDQIAAILAACVAVAACAASH